MSTIDKQRIAAVRKVGRFGYALRRRLDPFGKRRDLHSADHH